MTLNHTTCPGCVLQSPVASGESWGHRQPVTILRGRAVGRRGGGDSRSDSVPCPGPGGLGLHTADFAGGLGAPGASPRLRGCVASLPPTAWPLRSEGHTDRTRRRNGEGPAVVVGRHYCPVSGSTVPTPRGFAQGSAEHSVAPKSCTETPTPPAVLGNAGMQASSQGVPGPDWLVHSWSPVWHTVRARAFVQ